MDTGSETAPASQVEVPTLSGKFTYTLTEAAQILRLKYCTVARRARNGDIKTCPDIKPYRIPAAEMRRLIGQPQPLI